MLGHEYLYGVGNFKGLGVVDGGGRQHANIEAECISCGEKIKLDVIIPIEILKEKYK
jgi:hypothetical protein